MYTFTVKNEDYKLKLTTQEIINVEDKIGKNLILLFGRDGQSIPTVKDMITILHHSLQPYNHGFKYTDTCKLFDDWLEEGNTTNGFIPIMVEILKDSGVMKKGETEKN